MSKLVAIVTGINLSDPYDDIALSGSVQLEGAAGMYQWAANPSAGSTQTQLKTACVDAAETVANSHSLTYSNTTLVGWPDEAGMPDLTGLCAVPAAGSTISLALNTGRNPSSARSDSRPTRVTVSGGWSWNLTALGTQAGTLSLKSDSGGTPTTAVVTLPFSRGLTVGLTVGDAGTVPYCTNYDVPSGHSYLIATSGTGTFGSPLVVEQVM